MGDTVLHVPQFTQNQTNPTPFENPFSKIFNGSNELSHPLLEWNNELKFEETFVLTYIATE